MTRPRRRAQAPLTSSLASAKALCAACAWLWALGAASASAQDLNALPAPPDADADADADANAEADAAPIYRLDPRGQPFRVRFDPGNRTLLGVGVAFTTSAADRFTAPFELRVVKRIRHVLDLGQPDAPDFVRWRFDHHLLDTPWLWPAHLPGGIPSMTTTLYRGHYLRHAKDAALLIPTSPPVRLPFPLDLGFDLTAGQVWAPATTPTSAGSPQIPLLRLTPAAALITLDPWRSGHPGDTFTLGVGVRYDLDLEGHPTRGLNAPTIIHRVAPFTATSAHLRLEAADGLTAFDARADLTPHWASDDRAWRLAALSSLSIERALIAINDQPIVLSLDASYRLHPSTALTPTTHEWRAALALALAFSPTP